MKRNSFRKWLIAPFSNKFHLRKFESFELIFSFINLGDQGPTAQEEGLFKISDLKTAKDVEMVNDQAPDKVASDADSDEEFESKAKTVKYSKDKGELDQDQLQYSQKDVSTYI